MAAAVAPSRSHSQTSSLSDGEDLDALLAGLPDDFVPQAPSTPRAGAASPCGVMSRLGRDALQSNVVTNGGIHSLLDLGGGDGGRNLYFAQFTARGTVRLRALPHSNALTSPYTRSEVERVAVKECDLKWAVDAPDYAPPEYSAPSVLAGPAWADPVDVAEIKFNASDAAHKVDRTSHEGIYLVDPKMNRPLNPRGRTGLCGRGLLGRYGPNHAADPVITRWCRDETGDILLTDAGIPELEFVAIKRKDTGEWAIPGGMVDPGENISATLKREFGEETMASLELPPDELHKVKENLDRVLKGGIAIYSGYVDDHRNTDNAWMETTCVNFHDETGASTRPFKLAAGDDAGDVAWTRFYEGMPLYATHTIFLSLIYDMRVSWYMKEQAMV